METYRLTAAQDNRTGNYSQVGYIRVQDVATWIMQLPFLALITGVMGYGFMALARGFGRLPASFHVGPGEAAIGVVVFVVTIVAQESMHLLILRSYGARPRLGILGGNGAIFITIPEYGLRRNSLILTALAPLVLITCLALVGIWLLQGTAWVALLALMAVVNAGASTSDLWVVALLLRYPSSAWAVDAGFGMRVLMPMPPQQRVSEDGTNVS